MVGAVMPEGLTRFPLLQEESEAGRGGLESSSQVLLVEGARALSLRVVLWEREG